MQARFHVFVKHNSERCDHLCRCVVGLIMLCDRLWMSFPFFPLIGVNARHASSPSPPLSRSYGGEKEEEVIEKQEEEKEEKV